MKFFGNIILAVLVTFLLHCLMYELPTTTVTAIIKYYVRAVPMPMMVLILWVVFTFPEAVGNALSIIGNGIMKASMFVANFIGKSLETLWQYRAGKILISIAGICIAYFFIY